MRGFLVVAGVSARFPPSARVRTGAEYKRVFEQARRTAEPLLSLHVHAQGGEARLGLAVSRKVDKRAVGRNRIKRALRDEFRRIRSQLLPGDYVVVARAGASTAAPGELRAAFLRCLIRAGALPASATTGTMRAATTPPSSHPSTTSRPAAPAG